MTSEAGTSWKYRKHIVTIFFNNHPQFVDLPSQLIRI